jgi:hypothetical protein
VQIIESAINVAGVPVQQFVDQYHPAFPVGWNDRIATQVWLQMSLMQIPYVPHMVFIDRQGIIQADYPGESPFWQNQDGSVRAELEKILKASAPMPSSRKPGAKKGNGK